MIEVGDRVYIRSVTPFGEFSSEGEVTEHTENDEYVVTFDDGWFTEVPASELQPVERD